MIEIGVFHIPDRLNHFFSQNGGHSGIQRPSQVGKVNVVLGFDVRRQKLPAYFHYRLGVGQFFNFDAEDRVNDGKIVGRIGKPDRLVRPILIHGLFELAFSLGNYIVSSLDRCKSD